MFARLRTGYALAALNAMVVLAPLPQGASAQSLNRANDYFQQQYMDKMLGIESQLNQASSVSQFSDVQPSDWAYQALHHLSANHGCANGYSDGRFRGQQPLSRYEAAALLNHCLESVTEIDAEIKRLLREFETELAVLKAKVDGLEARQQELAATQFSTTTKLSGIATFWLGGAAFSGGNKGISPNAIDPAATAGGIEVATTLKRQALAFRTAKQLNLARLSAGGSEFSPTSTPSGNIRTLTKAATWTGGTSPSLISVVGQPAQYTLTGFLPGTSSGISDGGNPNGVLQIKGLRSNPEAPNGSSGPQGSWGFRNNALGNGTALTPELMARSALLQSNGSNGARIDGLPKGATLGGILLDKDDAGLLIALGNASRAVKGAGMILYSNDISSNPYQVASNPAINGFTNPGTFNNPLDLAIAEYGTLNRQQQRQPKVQKAAQRLLRSLYTEEIPLGESISFNYDIKLLLNTSFTGKDQLITRLRAGNFGDSIWSGKSFPSLSAAQSFDQSNTGSTWSLDMLYYQLPLSSEWMLTVGPRINQRNTLAVWPSLYSNNAILSFFDFAGAPGTYTSALGGGAGLWWRHKGLSVSGSYVAVDGKSSYPNDALGLANAGGIGNQQAGGTGTVQLAYQRPRWGVSAAWAYSQSGGAFDRGGLGSMQNETLGFIPVGTVRSTNPFAGLSPFSVNAIGLSGWWQPDAVQSWLPSISGGWGLNRYQAETRSQIWGITTNRNGAQARSESWYLGLQWNNILLAGNTLGTAIGQPTYLTSNDSFLGKDSPTFAWELWYTFQISDHFSVTPAVFVVNNPSGMGDNISAGSVLKSTLEF